MNLAVSFRRALLVALLQIEGNALIHGEWLPYPMSHWWSEHICWKISDALSQLELEALS